MLNFENRSRNVAEEIAEHRRRIKLYDIFTFFNELDLLEIRLNILKDYVDHFVIVESTETFSGQPKRLFFEEYQDRYAPFADKIIHYVVRDVPRDKEELRTRLMDSSPSELDRQIAKDALTSDNVLDGVSHWFKEFYQKESIKRALVGLNDNDVCFVSDVDEIWNPEAKIDLRKDDVFKLRQIVYSYYVNNRSSELWAGTLVTKYKNIKHTCLNHLRTASKTKYTYIENGGWHFTNQGGADRIREKIEASYGSEDLNTDAIKSKVVERMESNQDYIGRRFKFRKNDKGLPAYLLENRDRYRPLFQ